jgi:C4-dicarboxylate-specific signal transduction histidine kinase
MALVNLADADGTLVTRAKVVTACAIEAIEKLHDRQGALRDHLRAAVARHAHAGSPRWKCAGR